MTKKAGRPRDLSAPRHPNGAIKYPSNTKDLGTHELVLKRLSAIPPNSDETKASYPLGILYANKLITSNQHWAGKRYQALYSQAVRPLGISSVLSNLIASDSNINQPLNNNPQEPPDPIQIRLDYLAARKALMALGQTITNITDTIAVFDQAPIAGQIGPLSLGLSCLYNHFTNSDTSR